MTSIIETRGLVKKYGDFVANDGIDLAIEKGEVRAIIGENGAGKTTLMNMLYGIIPVTSGEILFEGSPVHMRTPKDAIDLGIGMIHQHFKLAPSLTIFENIVLGIELNKTMRVGGKQIKLPLIDKKREHDEVKALVEKYNFNLNVDDKVQNLSIGAKQRVEILKMLYRNVNVLILDEPTAVLIPQEIDELMTQIQDLKQMGKTVVIITHKLNEVKKCADNISVMRRGKLVGTVKNDENATMQSLAELMVGRPVLLRVKKSDKSVNRDKVLLEAAGLTAINAEGRKVVDDMSFRIYENEILGVAGIEGNGQTELMYLLTGLMKATGGSVKLEGQEVYGLWPDELRAAGIGIIPEDRYRQGVCMGLPVSRNLIAGYHDQEPFCHKGLMDVREMQKNKDRLVPEYDIRLSGKDPTAASLSGGNAQKVIVAREMSQDPKVLLVSQPTRGIDIGATEFIYKNFIKLRDEGKGILLISSELSEIKGLADRIIVVHNGRIVGEFTADDVSFNELGLYMSGAKSQRDEQ